MNQASLERDIADIRRQLAARPVLTPVVAVDRSFVARIIGGNTLSSGSAGIKHKASGTYADVDTAIDPYADPSLQDGLGYGYLYSDGSAVMVSDGLGGLRQRRALIANSYTTSVLPQALVTTEWVYLGSSLAIPGTGGNIAYSISGY